MSKAIVHVHQAEMRKGNPAIIVRTWRGSTHHRSVEFNGPARIVQSATPDACGARIWIEIDSDDLVLEDA